MKTGKGLESKRSVKSGKGLESKRSVKSGKFGKEGDKYEKTI